MNFPFGMIDWDIKNDEAIGSIPADASAAFGNNPDVTYWEMSHGAGGGVYHVNEWVHNADDLWKQAGMITQWHPS